MTSKRDVVLHMAYSVLHATCDPCLLHFSINQASSYLQERAPQHGGQQPLLRQNWGPPFEGLGRVQLVGVNSTEKSQSFTARDAPGLPRR